MERYPHPPPQPRQPRRALSHSPEKYIVFLGFSSTVTRIFVLKSNTACLDNINPRSPASSGRFDVVLDFVLECLFDRRGPRQDVVVYTVLDGCSPCRILRFDASSVPARKVDSEGEILKLVLERSVEVLELSFRQLLEKLRKDGVRLVCLFEEGEPVERYLQDLCSGDVAFIIGDQDGFTQSDLAVMREQGCRFVSIGPIPYLSWFCCVFVNYLLDTYCAST